MIERVHPLSQLFLTQSILQFLLFFRAFGDLVKISLYYHLVVPEFERQNQVIAVLVINLELNIVVILFMLRLVAQ